jgi:CBS domain-containing protein
MRVREAMSPNPRMVKPDVSLLEAAKVMRDLDCGCVLVGEKDRVEGILTDRDIVIRALAENRDPASARARDVMTTEVAYCFAHEPLEEAAETMRRKQIRRLAVHDASNRIAGILSVGDIARRCGDHKLVAGIEREICRKAA